MKKFSKILSLLISILIVIFEIIAFIDSYSRNGFGLFLFYTECSNFFAMIVCAIYSLYILFNYNKEIPKWLYLLKYMATLGLIITFIIVILILCPMYGANGYKMMLLYGSMLYQHLICPILLFFSFVFVDKINKITIKESFFSLIPTIIYALITIVLNILRIIEGPYPFLYVYNQTVLMSILWFIIIIGGSFLIANIIRVIVNRRK
jgi:hypothetical protein